MTQAAFYSRFERHAHGEGLKGRSTHYCPGCGHGLIHRYLAESISELGIQDRTIAVSPVGCSVFLYYYFDVGNTQAAHGRAPAVALGHKLANPEAVVVSYQGDGDLASIGLAEILHAAQLGVPLTVIFVNNAIYGMTGGQMAPTTPMGLATATCPDGRNRMMGSPLRMAEMIAGIDGSIYVERCALYDSRQRNRTRKAIRKALELQIAGRGFAFVEVLAECPTHLKMTPVESEKWVEETLAQIFPLGVKKDVATEPWFDRPRPSFDVERVMAEIGARTEPAPRFAKSFPTHLDPRDVSLKLAGAGGDGAQTAAMLVTRAAIGEGFDATHIPSYGPESRGGTSYADVHLALDEVLAPDAPEPQILLTFNAPSLEKFGPKIRPGGIGIYDSSVSHLPADARTDVIWHGVPFAEIARDLGAIVIKNVVALGALQAASELLPAESLLTTLRQALAAKVSLLELNEKAFALGRGRIESPKWARGGNRDAK